MLVRSSPAEGVLELRLHRPQQLNALTLALARELHDAAAAAAADPQVRVLLLAGDGRSFCAGKDRDDPPTAEFVQVLQGLARTLMQMPKPVVAAVQGWAVGAGLEILLNCDIVVAARDARFMLPEITIGLFGTGGVLSLLPRAMGLPRAKGALMLGEAFSAIDAHAWGLVWSLAAEEDLQATALAACTRLAGSDARVLAEIKRALHTETFADLDAVLERESEAHERLAGPD